MSPAQAENQPCRAPESGLYRPTQRRKIHRRRAACGKSCRNRTEAFASVRYLVKGISRRNAVPINKREFYGENYIYKGDRCSLEIGTSAIRVYQGVRATDLMPATSVGTVTELDGEFTEHEEHGEHLPPRLRKISDGEFLAVKLPICGTRSTASATAIREKAHLFRDGEGQPDVSAKVEYFSAFILRIPITPARTAISAE